MKRFLLIAPPKEGDIQTGSLTLSCEELAAFPLPLLKQYLTAKEIADATSAQAIEESAVTVDSTSLEVTEPKTETAAPEIFSQDETAEPITSSETVTSADSVPADDTEAENATLADSAEDPDGTEIAATGETKPKVLFISDSDDTIAKAKEAGYATLKLPRREFPVTNTLSVLRFDEYETVVCRISFSVEDSLLELFSDFRCLVFSIPSEDGQLTYRATYETVPSSYESIDRLFESFFDKSAPQKAPIDKPQPASHGIFEWLELFAVSLAAVLLIMTFFIRHSPVSGSSMAPTLQNGDVLLLTQVGFTADCGDIVIIQTDKDDLRRPLVKRVIATGNQTVRIDFETWNIYVDGILLKEDYLNNTDKSQVMELYSTAQFFEKVDEHHAIYEATVPEGHLFVMGDNRQVSLDSRSLGFIDERHVIGEVIYRLLPFSVMGDPS